jgi:hypothetical protein
MREGGGGLREPRRKEVAGYELLCRGSGLAGDISKHSSLAGSREQWLEVLLLLLLQ